MHEKGPTNTLGKAVQILSGNKTYEDNMFQLSKKKKEKKKAIGQRYMRNQFCSIKP